jgi:hypothetical protein
MIAHNGLTKAHSQPRFLPARKRDATRKRLIPDALAPGIKPL